MEEHLGVSIILVTYNARRFLETSLDRILDQRHEGDVEVIVIDSSSSDGTRDYLTEKGLNPVVIDHADFHHGRTRNMAAEMAKNEVLVFVSADATPVTDRWLVNLVAPFGDPLVGGVYGKQIPPDGTGPLRIQAMNAIYPDTRQVRCLPEGGTIGFSMIRFSNANCAVRATVWERFKFPDNVFVAEEHWLSYNILKHGMKLVYEPTAAVIHGHERSIWEEFRFAVDNGISLKRMNLYDDPRLGSEIRYGLRRVRDEVGHFASKRMYGYAIRSMMIAAAKWAGMQLGKRERALPHSLMRRISLNMARFDS